MSSAQSDPLLLLQSLLRAVPNGMHLGQLAALTAVASEPGLSVNDLADRIDIPQQTASRYVAQLMGRYQEPSEDKPPLPYLEQRVSLDDPRRRALYLTDLGKLTLNQVVAAGWQQKQC